MQKGYLEKLVYCGLHVHSMFSSVRDWKLSSWIYLTWIETERAEILPEDSFYVPLDIREVISSSFHSFKNFARKGLCTICTIGFVTCDSDKLCILLKGFVWWKLFMNFAGSVLKMFCELYSNIKMYYCCREQNLVQVTKINGWNQKIKRLDQRRLLKLDPWLCLSQIAL